MNKKYPQEMIQAGKIKHQRIINTTTMVVGVLGALIVGLILNPQEKILEFDKTSLLIALVGITIAYVFIENKQLDYLEEVFGWDKSIEKTDMNWIAKWIDKHIHFNSKDIVL